MSSAGSSAGRSAHVLLDLLDGPGVAVRVVEVDEGAVVGPVGLQPGGHHAALGEVLWPGVLDPGRLELAVRLLDVGHRELAALQRPRRDSAAETGPEDDRARRA